MSATRYQLRIRLGASQARKRLKGHGFGVRKIETAGSGHSVVTHTATGRHLDELRSLLFDVLEEEDAGRLSEDAE